MGTATKHTMQKNKADDQKVVEISHLSKAFDEHVVLRDISLYVAEGENLVIMGKSGTGKSVPD